VTEPGSHKRLTNDDHRPSRPARGSAPADVGKPVLAMRGITKDFSGIAVLKGVDFDLRVGEIHALMGENGAGKSTLMKVLGGIHPDHGGSIEVGGHPVRLASPRDAAAHGIAFIHQELNLVPELTVAENIYLGREPRRGGCLIDRRRMARDAAALLSALDFRARPDDVVGRLRVGEQQVVEIAKALSLDARILIMDEPTSALSQSEVAALFRVIRGLADRGVAIIYITHRMEEVFHLADRVTVLRDGAVVTSTVAEATSRRALIRHMVGRDLQEFFAAHQKPAGRVVLEVEDLWLEQPAGSPGRQRIIDGVSFGVRAGEVFGIAGLLGAGRTELLETLFGANSGEAGGRVRLDGRPIDIGSPAAAKRAGLALVTEDRRRDGLVLDAAIGFNLALPTVSELATLGLVSGVRERGRAQEAIRQLAVRAKSLAQSVATLSGGTQQKVVIGKWLPTRPKVLLLDEPTRGIDVGTKAEIYRLIAGLAQSGVAIVMVSSELPELLSLSDRILVLREGRATALLDKGEFSAERIIDYASPGGDIAPPFRRAMPSADSTHSAMSSSTP
jgi:ribose transport system ATP-binding protein